MSVHSNYYADPDEYATILPETIGCITLHDHNTYYYDLEIYCACITYNSCRMQYIYNNPTEASNILQVKDELTGKNILIPNDVQAELLQADINSLPCCENIDMYQVETEEDFYLSYGVSVQEILNSNLMYEPNKTAVAGVIEVEE